MSVTCVICHFATELDDVAISGQVDTSRVICLRCYTRETATTKPIPKVLRHEVLAVLAAAEG